MKVPRGGRPIVLAAAVVVAVMGCNAFAPRTSLPPLLPGAVRIATDNADPGAGLSVMCRLGRALNPVVGALAGENGKEPFSSWLVRGDGSPLYVVWPRGFSARFQPDLELIDRNNIVVARRGAAIDLNVDWDPALGTAEHPYVTQWVNDACYPPYH
jgi:hypothetical protein